jgi:gliding motility-associated-like protein
MESQNRISFVYDFSNLTEGIAKDSLQYEISCGTQKDTAWAYFIMETIPIEITALQVSPEEVYIELNEESPHAYFLFSVDSLKIIANYVDDFFGGETSKSHTFENLSLADGRYIVQGCNSGNCCALDSFEIKDGQVVNPPCIKVTTPVLGNVCVGENYTQNGFTIPAHNTDTTILDTLYLLNQQGCDSIITLTLRVLPAPIIHAVVDSSRIAVGKQVQLNVETSGFYTYLWDNADLVSNLTAQNPTAIIRASTPFTVTATDPLTDCKTTDSVFVEAISLPCNKDLVYIPNAFTPNGDGVNDIFKVRSESLLSGTLMIFDRWGNKIFETHDLTQGWDGYYKGKKQQAESYGYYFSGVCAGGETVALKGNVTVLE